MGLHRGHGQLLLRLHAWACKAPKLVYPDGRQYLSELMSYRDAVDWKMKQDQGFCACTRHA
eukprot:5746648-Lingulodinium_polyedra.AAC.1